MSDSAREPRPDLMGGPEPAEEDTDVLPEGTAPGLHTDVMGGPGPAPAGSHVMGGPGAHTDLMGAPEPAPAGSDVMADPGEPEE